LQIGPFHLISTPPPPPYSQDFVKRYTKNGISEGCRKKVEGCKTRFSERREQKSKNF